MKAAILILTLSASSFAGEFAVLSTGFRLHADHHQTEGTTVKLYQKDGGYTQIDASLVIAYEKEVELAVESPPAVAAPTAAPPARELVEAAAKKNGLPPSFVHSVVAAGSGYKVDAVS